MTKKEILELIIKQNGGCDHILCDECESANVGCSKITNLSERVEAAKLELAKLKNKDLECIVMEQKTTQPKPKYTPDEIEFMDKCAIACVSHGVAFTDKFTIVYSFAKQALDERRKVLAE